MELVHIPYSPWSERARWALDCARLAYTSTVYTPGLSEPGLRIRLRRPTARLTLPVLFDGETVFDDSLDIARRAAKHAPGLLPPGTDILNETVEVALSSGRILGGRRMLGDPVALAASVPPGLGLPTAIARAAARKSWERIVRKYDPGALDDAKHTDRLTSALDDLEAAVGEGPYVTSTFSYADILVASALDFVEPRTDIPLPPVVVARWRHPELAERYRRLIRWRDTLRATHRRR